MPTKERKQKQLKREAASPKLPFAEKARLYDSTASSQTESTSPDQKHTLVVVYETSKPKKKLAAENVINRGVEAVKAGTPRQPPEVKQGGLCLDVSDIIALPRSEIDDKIVYQMLTDHFKPGSDFVFPSNPGHDCNRKLNRHWLLDYPFLAYS